MQKFVIYSILFSLILSIQCSCNKHDNDIQHSQEIKEKDTKTDLEKIADALDNKPRHVINALKQLDKKFDKLGLSYIKKFFLTKSGHGLTFVYDKNNNTYSAYVSYTINKHIEKEFLCPVIIQEGINIEKILALDRDQAKNYLHYRKTESSDLYKNVIIIGEIKLPGGVKKRTRGKNNPKCINAGNCRGYKEEGNLIFHSDKEEDKQTNCENAENDQGYKNDKEENMIYHSDKAEKNQINNVENDQIYKEEQSLNKPDREESNKTKKRPKIPKRQNKFNNTSPSYIGEAIQSMIKKIYRTYKQPVYQPEGTEGYPEASDLNFDSLHESFKKALEEKKEAQKRRESPEYLAEQAAKEYNKKKSLYNWREINKRTEKYKNQRLLEFGDIFCFENVKYDLEDIEDFIDILEEEKLNKNDISESFQLIIRQKSFLEKHQEDLLKIVEKIQQVNSTGLSDQIKYYQQANEKVKHFPELLDKIAELQKKLNSILTENKIDIKIYQTKAGNELAIERKKTINQYLLTLKDQGIIINGEGPFEAIIQEVENKKQAIKAHYRAERKMELALQPPLGGPSLLPLEHKAPNQLHTLRQARKELLKYVPLQFLEDRDFKFKKITNIDAYQLNVLGTIEIDSSDEEDLWSTKDKKQQKAFLQGIGSALKGEVEGYITLFTNPKATIEGFLSLFEKLKKPALFFDQIRKISKEISSLDEISKAEKLGEILTEAILMVMPGKGKLLKNLDNSIKYKAGKALLRGKVLSNNQIQGLINKKKSPKTIRRHSPGGKFRNEPKHIHFQDGSALYENGIWKHNQKNGKKHKITKQEKRFLEDIGYNLP